MSEHTPLPWKLDAQDPRYIRSALNKSYIAAIQSDNVSDGRFIVTACNCHADLLEALKWAVDWAHGLAELFGPEPAWIPKAKKAIREAEEKMR